MKVGSLFFILLGAVYFSSCTKKDIKKDVPIPKQANGKEFVGVWELRAVKGGMIPFNPNHFRPGNGNLWKFTQTAFARIHKDSVHQSGTYSISRGTGTDLNTGRKIDQFFFNDKPAESFESKNDTLMLYYGSFSLDGVIEMYVKIAEDPTVIAVP